NLYALGRVNDYLLMSFQGHETGARTQARLTRDEYLEFFCGLGFTPFTSDRFSPFRHEVFRADVDQDAAAPIGVIDIVWPGLMFGDLMFSRSGVAVLGGSDYVVPQVA